MAFGAGFLGHEDFGMVKCSACQVCACSTSFPFLFPTLPQLLSDPLVQFRAMQNETKGRGIAAEELIAVFGDARLVKCDGRLHRVGGSMADRTEAMEWVMMFLPDESVRLAR